MDMATPCRETAGDYGNDSNSSGAYHQDSFYECSFDADWRFASSPTAPATRTMTTKSATTADWFDYNFIYEQLETGAMRRLRARATQRSAAARRGKPEARATRTLRQHLRTGLGAADAVAAMGVTVRRHRCDGRSHRPKPTLSTALLGKLSRRSEACIDAGAARRSRRAQTADETAASLAWSHADGCFRCGEGWQRPPHEAMLRPHQQRQPSRAERASAADALGIDLSLYQVLEQLQYGDITPEDYDVLLQLSVVDNKPATMEVASARRFPRLDVVAGESDSISASQLCEGTQCVVCLEDMCVGDVAQRLPCGHVFHASCIERWLVDGAEECPLRDWKNGDSDGEESGAADA